jgi:hypothetical protein
MTRNLFQAIIIAMFVLGLWIVLSPAAKAATVCRTPDLFGLWIAMLHTPVNDGGYEVCVLDVRSSGRLGPNSQCSGGKVTGAFKATRECVVEGSIVYQGDTLQFEMMMNRNRDFANGFMFVGNQPFGSVTASKQ